MTFHKQSEIYFDSQKVAEDSVGPNKNVSEDRDIRSWRFCAAATSQIPFNYGKVVSLPKKKNKLTSVAEAIQYIPYKNLIVISQFV